MKKLLLVLSLFILGSATVWAGEKTPARKVTQSLVQIDDTVRLLRRVPGATEVVFETHAGIYSVHRTNSRYEVLVKALQASRQNDEHISVTADPTSLEIADLVE